MYNCQVCGRPSSGRFCRAKCEQDYFAGRRPERDRGISNDFSHMWEQIPISKPNLEAQQCINCGDIKVGLKRNADGFFYCSIQCYNTYNKVKIKKDKPMTNSSDSYISKAISNMKSTAKTTKDSVITAQKGTLAIATVKTGLMKSPLPDTVKAFIQTPGYGDLAVGALLNIIVPTITTSKQASSVAEAANVVSAMELSKQFTWLQDIVSSAIESIGGKDEAEVKTKVKTDEEPF